MGTYTPAHGDSLILFGWVQHSVRSLGVSKPWLNKKKKAPSLKLGNCT
jgi:hypothetical protein